MNIKTNNSYKSLILKLKKLYYLKFLNLEKYKYVEYLGISYFHILPLFRNKTHHYY